MADSSKMYDPMPPKMVKARKHTEHFERVYVARIYARDPERRWTLEQ